VIRKRFPILQYGYFNPPKERFKASLDAAKTRIAP